MENSLKHSVAKPFLRWAGGKSWLTKTIGSFIPENFNNYHEPFVGGGSIFFHLKAANLLKKDAYLSDLNPSLIKCYAVIRDDLHSLLQELQRFSNSSEMYYKERNSKYDDAVKEAARFLYLNRTSFNGIYRENLKGEYNVPYGYKQYKELFDFQNIVNASIALQRANLANNDFEKAISNAGEGDLVFIDPPYTVAHENNGFVKYNQRIFSWDDQVRLRDTIKELENRGAYYILTNAYHESLIDLYNSTGSLIKMERFSGVGGNKAKRDKYHELIITNVK